MTKAEKDYLGRIQSLGCIICGSPASIHHVRRYGEKRKHEKATPLCYFHHQGAEGIHHLGKREWERRYMTQDELLAETYRRLGQKKAM